MTDRSDSGRKKRVGVVGGGAAAVDTILFVDSVLGNGKARILGREQRFGGNIAIAMVTAARTGVATSFLGHLPASNSDEGLLNFLAAEGVDVSNARVDASNRPITSTILVGSDGERFIAFDDDTRLGLPEDLDLDLVRSARVLLVDEYGLQGGIRAATAAREAGVSIVADIERAADPDVRFLLDLADHLILPRELALTWTGTTTPTESVQALWRSDRAAVVVTGGSDGCWYRAVDQPDAATVTFHPARQVHVVDTTGCGDVFHGAYAAALAQGQTTAQCVAEATLAAAECATHPGGVAPRSEQAPSRHSLS